MLDRIKDNVLAAVLALDFLTTSSKNFGLAHAWAERILGTHQISPEYLMHMYNALSNKEVEIDLIIEYVTKITGDSMKTAITDIQKCKKPDWKELKEEKLINAYDAMQTIYKKHFEQANPYVYTPEQIRDALSKINTIVDQIELKILFDEEAMKKTIKLLKIKDQKGLLTYTQDQSTEIEHMVPKNDIRINEKDILGFALLLVAQNKLKNIISNNPIAVIAYLNTTNHKDFKKAYSNMMDNYKAVSEYRSKYLYYFLRYDIKNISLKNFPTTPPEYNAELHIVILKDYYTFTINTNNKYD